MLFQDQLFNLVLSLRLIGKSYLYSKTQLGPLKIIPKHRKGKNLNRKQSNTQRTLDLLTHKVKKKTFFPTIPFHENNTKNCFIFHLTSKFPDLDVLFAWFYITNTKPKIQSISRQ